jgi:hypothetical protein
MQKTRGVAIVVSMACTVLMAAGCRQKDGPLPTPTGEQPNKIYDIGRDLQNVAGGVADAEQDLMYDVDGLDSNSRPTSLVRQLSTSAAAAVKGKSLPDKPAQDIAQLIFVAATAEELSPRQIEKVATDLRTTVVNAGGDAAAAGRVASAATALQQAITLNPKRWYHIF